MVIFSFIGFFSCLFFIKIGINPIVASALTGFIVSLLPFSNKSNISTLVYCSSFAAIGVTELTNSFVLIFLLPILLMFIYQLTKTVAKGYGGKLGTIAFVSSGIFYLLLRLI